MGNRYLCRADDPDEGRTRGPCWCEVFLWTLRDAARARRFYEKVGFRLTGNTRAETLTNWTTGAGAERPAVEYATTLANQRRPSETHI